MSERLFLGVEASAGGRRWVHSLSERGEQLASQIVQTHGLPDILARVLSARGIAPPDALRFLAPTIRDLMPDPSSLTDMDAAAARLADAVERREPVAIFGDYDVDGAASAALLWRYLAHFGLDPVIRIPDRITEGYGPNPEAIGELAAAGARLIVTVDCGTTSFEALEAGRTAGVDVVVLDHHQTGASLPPAVAIVNPNRQDDLSGQGHLAAVGVVFLTCAAISRELRRRGRRAADLPDILSMLDLAALATICDVVPLTGFNRALVVKGLSVMRAQGNAGLRALAEVARVSGPLDPYHLGFILGPRINAGGRIGEAHLGSRLLTVSDANEATALALQLHSLNEERQAMERHMVAEAEAEVAAEIGAGEGPPVLVAVGAEWHPGIVGLIAARLKERHRRPAFAIAFDPSGKGSGSGRSVPGFDIGTLVRGAVEAGILEKGGGHRMAAGLTIRRESLGAFRAYVETHAGTLAADLRKGEALAIDGAVSAMGLTRGLLDHIESAGPYGSGHAAPVLALPRHRVESSGTVGTGHVRATLKAQDGATISAIAFRAEETDVGRALLDHRNRLVHVAGTPVLERYRGRESVGFRIIDVAPAGL
ncbi:MULTISPECIES: single-stranded-DNA-specific exonuclease RecJ [unclassified Aureimonas]|uniref:single-stranded-DNA-specific exonuclease RecJ n=1 Tax=unclassified Aureimonas TaxID=2615206 RepID=UPI0006FD7AE9|nr:MULTISPECIES: single-stranded-DNA-specific exonuclease RecJ [unclassified Aureimonas]KQT57463.1 single-stranded-DNA-specific exonuclease RecJ [Aureimonas sp. Leaf427]KQT77142.1 single-stranded-DNA-specific exonuclease RecJ [Aureimonas sp. Leaf460]